MRQMNHKELPMLAGIAGLIRWCEELVNLISGPLLTLGLGIALVDLLTDGHLLTAWPILLYTWAITQAIGVDAQLVASWDRARIALRERRYWSLAGLLVLGLILAYVAWVASQVFALQQSEGLSTTQALSRLGMDSASWLIQRTALSVALVALAGWTRYHAPAPDVSADTEAERAKLEAELALAPLREQVRMRQVRGVRGLAAAALGTQPIETPAPSQTQFTQVEPEPVAVNTPSPMPDNDPPKPRVRKPRQSGAKGGKVVRLRNPSVEEKARAHWRPGISIPALQKAAGISRPSAQKYAAQFAAEDGQRKEAAQ